jgi:hypothetical protein
MSENSDSSCRRISYFPPPDFTRTYKTSQEIPTEHKPLKISDYSHAVQVLQQTHPWTVFPPVIKEMLRGQAVIHLKNNPEMSSKDLKNLLWELGSPLLQQLDMMVEVTEHSDYPGRFRVISINLISTQTRDQITNIIDPNHNPDEFFFEDEEPTDPGTPLAKKLPSRPPQKPSERFSENTVAENILRQLPPAPKMPTSGVYPKHPKR